jgi:hypothetical protein
LIVAVAVAVFLLGALITAWVGYMMPRYWERTSVIEPIPAASGILSATDPESACMAMLSGGNLSAVVDRLKLDDKWNLDRQSATRVLKESVSVRRNGNFITVSVRQRTPELARDVASAVPAVWGETTRARSAAEYRSAVERLEAQAANRAFEAGVIEQEMKQAGGNRAEFERELADMRKSQAAFEEEARRLKVLVASLTAPMVVHEEPALWPTPGKPDVPVKPDLSALFGRYLPVSLLAGLGLGLALAAMRQRMACGGPPATVPETAW